MSETVKKESKRQPAAPDEQELIERCRRGDSAAIETLLLRYQDRLYNTILKITGNSDDAAELLGDTFVKLIENIGDFESRSSFYTWAFSIAVNLTISHCRRKQKVRFSSIDEQDETDSEGKAALKEVLLDKSSPDPAALSQNAELCELTMKMLGRLSDEHRIVLVLRDIEGMDYTEVAATLGINEGTVKSRLNRARNNLRELLESFLDEK
jgi:RNA polymerase sigma-70 factor (ECF subfamily)